MEINAPQRSAQRSWCRLAPCAPPQSYSWHSSPEAVPHCLRDTASSDTICTASKQIFRRSRASCRSHGGQLLQDARIFAASSCAGRPIVAFAASETRTILAPWRLPHFVSCADSQSSPRFPFTSKRRDDPTRWLDVQTTRRRRASPVPR